MRGKPKIGDIVEFSFAGSLVCGNITELINDKYKVYDGKYTYTITKEMITKKHKKEI